MDIYPFGKLDILIYPEKDLDIGYFYYIKYPFWQLVGYDPGSVGTVRYFCKYAFITTRRPGIC